MKSLAPLVVLSLASACTQPDDTGPTGPVTVSFDGGVQKGPYVIGSAVQISLLDTLGNPTGEVFNTSTTNDLGEFEVAATVPVPSLAEINTSGFYFDEVTGALADAQLTLRSVIVLDEGGDRSTYVNTLTHLAEKRARALVADGTGPAAALAQAEGEARAALGMIEPASVASADQMTMLGGDTPDNAYLLAVSCVLGQAAQNEVAGTESSAPAKLQEILNTLALDLQDDGALEPARQAWIDSGRGSVDGSRCMDHLATRLAELGDTSTEVPDVTTILDFDRDGEPDATDDDDDGDGIPAEDDRLVGGAAIRASWFGGSGEGHHRVLVARDNIEGDGGGHAWAVYVDDSESAVYRTAPYRIEGPDGAPLTGIVQIETVEDGLPFLLLAQDGTLYAWTPGAPATVDDTTPADVTRIQLGGWEWRWAVTSDHEWYAWAYPGWAHVPDMSGHRLHVQDTSGPEAWVEGDQVSTRSSPSSEIHTVTGTTGTIVELAYQSHLFLLNDEGTLFSLDPEQTTTAAPLAEPSGVVDLSWRSQDWWASTPSALWQLGPQPAQHTVGTPVWYSLGDIEIDEVPYEAYLTTDGAIHLEPILDEDDPRTLEVPR